MPVPSGSRSSRRIGNGFQISKTRKSIRPARNVFQASGTAMSATSCPATSSMTTNCGSFKPEARATRVAAGIPMSVTTRGRDDRRPGAVRDRDARDGQRPNDNRGERSPSAGAGFEASYAEEGRDQRGPERSAALGETRRADELDQSPSSSSGLSCRIASSASATGDAIT